MASCLAHPRLQRAPQTCAVACFGTGWRHAHAAAWQAVMPALPHASLQASAHTHTPNVTRDAWFHALGTTVCTLPCTRSQAPTFSPAAAPSALGARPGHWCALGRPQTPRLPWRHQTPCWTCTACDTRQRSCEVGRAHATAPGHAPAGAGRLGESLRLPAQHREHRGGAPRITTSVRHVPNVCEYRASRTAHTPTVLAWRCTNAASNASWAQHRTATTSAFVLAWHDPHLPASYLRRNGIDASSRGARHITHEDVALGIAVFAVMWNAGVRRHEASHHTTPHHTTAHTLYGITHMGGSSLSRISTVFVSTPCVLTRALARLPAPSAPCSNTGAS